jgi:hypothetical protein
VNTLENLHVVPHIEYYPSPSSNFDLNGDISFRRPSETEHTGELHVVHTTRRVLTRRCLTSTGCIFRDRTSCCTYHTSSTYPSLFDLNGMHFGDLRGQNIFVHTTRRVLTRRRLRILTSTGIIASFRGPLETDIFRVYLTPSVYHTSIPLSIIDAALCLSHFQPAPHPILYIQT